MGKKKYDPYAVTPAPDDAGATVEHYNKGAEAYRKGKDPIGAAKKAQDAAAQGSAKD